MMTLPDAPTRLPEPHIPYHRNPEFGRPLREFAERWIQLSCPDLERIWRDSGGGWVRWIWFRDEGGQCHAFHVPSHARAEDLTEKERLFIRVLAGRARAAS